MKKSKIAKRFVLSSLLGVAAAVGMGVAATNWDAVNVDFESQQFYKKAMAFTGGVGLALGLGAGAVTLPGKREEEEQENVNG